MIYVFEVAVADDRVGVVGIGGEPVTIEKKGRPVAVVLSLEEYQRLEALDDAWWAARAEKAGEEGFIGPEESARLLKEMLNAKD